MIDHQSNRRGSRYIATPSKAFTLVEILVVLVILSIMGSMVVTAVGSVTDTARTSRTRSIIAACDSVIQDHYDSFKYRPLPVEIPNLFQEVVASDNEVGLEVLATEAARVRLIMTRDLQRMELPDRHSDYIATATALVPLQIWAAANPVLVDTATDEIIGSRATLTRRKSFTVTWSAPQSTLSFQDRYSDATTASGATAIQIVANQGAECLYAIMANTFVAGRPAISSLPASNIADTDGDGLPEILDGWGQPLGFIRWPAGYFDVEADLTTDQPDDFDPFRVDFAYASGATTSQATDVNDTDGTQAKPPWSLRPLIVSAGADGFFGLAFDPQTSSGVPNPTFSYSDDAWDIQTTPTLASEFMGSEAAGRANSADAYNYPDPYLRRFLAINASGVMPGQIISGTTGLEQVADNVSNYSLQAEQ